MNEVEQDYRDRSKRLFQVGADETDPDLQAVLLAQSERIGMKAITLELARKQQTLTARGVPLHA